MVLPRGATLTQVINAVPGNETTEANGTQTLTLTANHIDQTLEAHAANYVEFETHINATSQVRAMGSYGAQGCL